LSLSVKRQFTLQIADLYLFTSKRTIARVHSKNPGNDAEPMQYWKAKKTPDAINPKGINLHFRWLPFRCSHSSAKILHANITNKTGACCRQQRAAT
jgi:hypothetical protein